MTDNKLADAKVKLIRSTVFAAIRKVTKCADITSGELSLATEIIRGLSAALAEHDAKCDYDYARNSYEPVPPPANGEADEFDKPAMELTALRKKLAAAEDAAKSAGEAESIMLFEIERMYQESRATLIRAAIAALQQPVTLREVTDEDAAKAECERVRSLKAIAAYGSAGVDERYDMAMRAALEFYRARLMTKGVPND